jgi:uncharacterized membrane protein
MLVKALGDNGYMGLYSLISIAVIVWLSYLYTGADHSDYLWMPALINNAVAKTLMPVSLIFLVLGVATKNPTAMKMEAALEVEAQGILRITRHPVQWAILLWASAHIIANGDVASLIFFGSFAVVSGLGTVLMDRKLSVREGARWQPFAAATSNVPFLAIVAGRNSLRPAELGWKGMLVAVVLFVLVYIFHDLITGVALYAS